MLVSMKRSRIGQAVVGTDTVIAGWPIPPGGRLVNVKGNINMKQNVVNALEAVLHYGVSGYVVPVLDPDAAADLDAIWDTLIPKDETEADDALDFDTGTADPTPEVEPGEPNINAVLGIDAVDIVEVFKRRKWITASNSPVGIHLDTTMKYTPMDNFSVNVSRQVSVARPSMLLFGMSMPVTTTTQTAQRTAPTKQEWGMMIYLESTLEDMMKLLISLPEAGAESPYEEAAAMLADLLEPTVIEDTARAGDFVGATMDFECFLTAQVDFAKPRSLSNLSAG